MGREVIETQGARRLRGSNCASRCPLSSLLTIQWTCTLRTPYYDRFHTRICRPFVCGSNAVRRFRVAAIALTTRGTSLQTRRVRRNRAHLVDASRRAPVSLNIALGRRSDGRRVLKDDAAGWSSLPQDHEGWEAIHGASILRLGHHGSWPS